MKKSVKIMALMNIELKNVGRCSYCASQPIVWNREETQIGSFVSIGVGRFTT